MSKLQKINTTFFWFLFGWFFFPSLNSSLVYCLGFLILTRQSSGWWPHNWETIFVLLFVFSDPYASGQKPTQREHQSRLWAKVVAKSPLWIRMSLQIICFLGIYRSHWWDEEEVLPRGMRQKNHSESISFHHSDWQSGTAYCSSLRCYDLGLGKQSTDFFVLFCLLSSYLSSILVWNGGCNRMCSTPLWISQVVNFNSSVTNFQ